MRFFHKKTITKKVSLPANWPLPAVQPSADPGPIDPPGSKRVVNLAQPPAPPKATKVRKQLKTPVPARLGQPVLNLTGKADVFTRTSRNIVDMRKPRKKPGTKNQA